MEERDRQKLFNMEKSLKSIDETLKKMLDFFYSMEEMNLGDDPNYQNEIKKDGFHPPLG